MRIFSALFIFIINFSFLICPGYLYPQLNNKEKEMLISHFGNTVDISSLVKNGDVSAYNKLMSDMANESYFHEFAQSLLAIKVYYEVKSSLDFCEAADTLLLRFGENYVNNKFPYINSSYPFCFLVNKPGNVLKGEITESDYSVVETYIKRRGDGELPAALFNILAIEYAEQIEKLKGIAGNLLKERHLQTETFSAENAVSLYLEYRYQKILHIKLIDDMERGADYADNNIKSAYDKKMIKLLQELNGKNENLSISFSGEWETNWGKMELTQTNYDVTGKYEHHDGKISGKIENGVLKGTWSEARKEPPDPSDFGDFIFTLGFDGNSFTGKWRYSNDKEGVWHSDWSGKRIK